MPDIKMNCPVYEKRTTIQSAFKCAGSKRTYHRSEIHTTKKYYMDGIESELGFIIETADHTFTITEHSNDINGETFTMGEMIEFIFNHIA